MRGKAKGQKFITIFGSSGPPEPVDVNPPEPPPEDDDPEFLSPISDFELERGETLNIAPHFFNADTYGLAEGTLTSGLTLSADGTFSAAADAALGQTGELMVYGENEVVGVDPVTSFQLTTTAASGTYPFTIGLGFGEGDVPASISFDISTVQVIVKRRWNDGSVKHANVSGRAALTQNVASTIQVSRGTVAPGTALTSADIVTAAPTASVQCGAFGTVSLANLLSSPIRTWISGPEMVECHYRGDVGGGTLISVWFHVRLFIDGRVWIRAIVENGYLDNGAGALSPVTGQTYIPTISIGGTVVYNNGGASILHFKHTGYNAQGWIGGDPQITPQHEVLYLRDTKLVPNYWQRTPTETALNALTQTYTPFGNGEWEERMGNGGFQNQLGLLPQWDALYCTSGDARAWRSVNAHVGLFSSYPVCRRDFATKLPVKPSDKPTWTVNGPGGGGDFTLERSDDVLAWEYNHSPSAGYLPYLVTGDYFAYEAMLHQCAIKFLGISSSGGSGLTRNLMRPETRGYGWMLRTLSQLAALCPTDDPVAADYRTLLANQFGFCKTLQDNPNMNGLHILYVGTTALVESLYGDGRYNMFQHHFWAQSVGMASDIEPLDDMTVLNEHRDYIYAHVVGMLGPVGVDNYCYARMIEWPRICPSTSANPHDFYDTWGEVYLATMGVPNTACGDTIFSFSMVVDGVVPFVVPQEAVINRFGNWLPAIAYAVDHGYPGAAASWARLTSATNWHLIRDSVASSRTFNTHPNWGIVPRDWEET
jgi:hypothetical protein